MGEVNVLQREHSAKVQAMVTELERVRAQLQRLPEETEYRRMCEKVTALHRQFMSDDGDEEIPLNASLETVLSAKVRALQREVEVLRKGAKSAATELSATRQKLESVSSEHCAAKSLIEKLENDLIVTNKRESEEKKV